MLKTWILSLMLTLQPKAPWADTYESTAESIATVVESEAPLFAGDKGREMTAALLVSVAWFESTFKPTAIGDSGRSFGLFQIQKGNLSSGVTSEILMKDPQIGVREALRLLRKSMQTCTQKKVDERLALYVSGSCERGEPASRARMGYAKHLVAKHPPPPR